MAKFTVYSADNAPNAAKASLAATRASFGFKAAKSANGKRCSR
jgi:hypothetical protein